MESEVKTVGKVNSARVSQGCKEKNGAEMQKGLY